MFLTAPELEQLTGYRRYSKQREVLERNAVPYFTAASGRPVVSARNRGAWRKVWGLYT